MIKIKKQGKQIQVITPYDKEFVKRAKNFGGVWLPVSKCWEFDGRDEENIRHLCIELFGTDGSHGHVTTLRLEAMAEDSEFCSPVRLAGIAVAVAKGRDSGARPGENVIILKGEFESGGSVKNWKSIVPAGTLFELRDIDVGQAEKIKAECANLYKIEEVPAPEDSSTVQVKLDALLAERERLDQEIAKLQEKINQQ